jgi:hypothetical protein
MKIPIPFPSAASKLERDAGSYLSATGEERLRALFGISVLTDDLLAASPDRERQLDLLDAEEEREHDVWRSLIRAHGLPSGPPG